MLRLADGLWWKFKLQHTEYSGKLAIERFAAGLYATAIAWSIYAVVVLKKADSIELATTMVCLSALTAGGAIVLAAHRNTAMSYVFILMLPCSFGLFTNGDDYKQLLGIIGLAFCLVMIFVVRKAAEFMSNAILFKNENAALVHDMEGVVERRTRRIYELSNIDPLTHLFNRTAFLKHFKKQLNSCIKDKKNLALLFIDLDGFKAINDMLGHEIGDQLLLLTAKRLKGCCLSDQLLCRWGGDEFLLAIKDVKEAKAVEQAEQLIRHISQAYTVKGNRLSISATIGMVMYPQHGHTEDELIQLADAAMYYQKKREQSKVNVYSEYLGKKLRREQRLKDGLVSAIEKQQLRLVFQPIVSSSSGQVEALEALLRWQLDEEEIQPEEFICLAEQYGHISKLGAWVLNQACAAASAWDKSRRLAVCVNVSVMQLYDKNFLAYVDEALVQNNLPAELLHIEITESVFANDKDIVLTQIKALQSKGIKVSIDDFGTGYSSLSVMQDIAVNIVKIDRSFVEKLNTNGFAIINAVMNIAQTLDYLVVVEGVETRQQAKTLADMGVHFQQGFYYAKPMEQGQIQGFLDYNDTDIPTLVHGTSSYHNR